MKHLWAPWRGEYIVGEKSGECVFCVPGEERLLLFDGPLSIVRLNKFPYNNGHLLVSPKNHVSSLEELSADELSDISRLLVHSTVSIKKAMNAEGFNIGLNLGSAAGAGIAGHIHWHVVPRWGGDANFMPVVGEMKVIPEHLAETRAKLKPHFEKL